MHNQLTKDLLKAVKMDLEDVLRVTNEDYTSDTLKRVTEHLNAIINDLQNKEYKTTIKQMLYARMMNYKNTDKARYTKAYELYQNYKIGNVSPNEILTFLTEESQ